MTLESVDEKLSLVAGNLGGVKLKPPCVVAGLVVRSRVMVGEVDEGVG